MGTLHHVLTGMQKISSLSYSGRLQVLKQNALCYGCLRIGHVVRNRKNRYTCIYCKKRHPLVLHVEGGTHKAKDSATTPRVVVNTSVANNLMSL